MVLEIVSLYVFIQLPTKYCPILIIGTGEIQLTGHLKITNIS